MLLCITVSSLDSKKKKQPTNRKDLNIAPNVISNPKVISNHLFHFSNFSSIWSKIHILALNNNQEFLPLYIWYTSYIFIIFFFGIIQNCKIDSKRQLILYQRITIPKKSEQGYFLHLFQLTETFLQFNVNQTAA